MVVVALIVGVLIGRSSGRRVRQRKLDVLDNAARRWGQGDYGIRIGLRGKSALARLGKTLDSMAEAAQTREAGRAGVEEDLRRSRDEALQASLSKSRFLAAASHDLRQPLQSMSMTVALLEMRHKADADAPVIARLNRAVTNLAELLNTLLDISQLEAGLVKPNLKTFSIAGLLNEISEEYCAVAESKGLSFVVQSSDFTVRSDPSMLGRMLRNLVENAIRFTPAGGIIDVFARDDGSELLLIVRDTGIGIPEERQHEIFRAFQQLNNPERDRSKGLGLGLAIVDRMSRLLGHALVVESRPGEGSTFSIAVPKGHTVAAEVSQPVLSGEVHGRVLLVEDDELVLTTTAQLLEELGATVTKARSTEEALSRLDSESFDLLIADYRLPGSSGVELVRHARQRRPDIAAAVITGDPSIEELRRLVESDTDVIQKPVRADRLARLFSRLTHA
ncbi:MAG: two-component hybrid sensor and regulator [Betaproteobacteria bacterium]|nr:two-component hybrid sensor and regulator [Betaproteobacteria bacterium]